LARRTLASSTTTTTTTNTTKNKPTPRQPRLFLFCPFRFCGSGWCVYDPDPTQCKLEMRLALGVLFVALAHTDAKA
jgi:hypothetical protein